LPSSLQRGAELERSTADIDVLVVGDPDVGEV
jgi:hypothetical protein